MSLPDSFSYHFYPVGQGLFSAGSIHRVGEQVSRFSWVYDCGTSSRQDLIRQRIEQYETWVNGRRRIDLLVLSHFDRDHISGVCRLIERFQIGTLTLPYMPLGQRLVIAFSEGLGFRDELIHFFVNPVDYLIGVKGAQIDRILFVPPSFGQETPVPPGLDSNRPAWGEDRVPQVEFGPVKERSDDYERGVLVATPSRSGQATQVLFLRRGGTLNIYGLWEFVPYNDDPEKEIPKSFMDEVIDKRDQLLASKGLGRDLALNRIIVFYDYEFGRKSKDRNRIPLFLYSGPIYSSWRAVRLGDWLLNGERSIVGEGKGSLLYSGDGYLNSDNKLDRLIAYIGDERIQSVGLFQVMHHGSRRSWHCSVAAAIQPSISVFSCDTKRRPSLHPHREVLGDFSFFGPKLVDKVNPFSAWGALEER